MAERHGEFLARGGRVYGISADSPGQNSAVMEKLLLPFPILSDPDRTEAIEPLGFADEKHPRLISRPGVVVVNPAGEIVYRFVGRDYADRPDEDELLAVLDELGLDPVGQDQPERGQPEPGESAFPFAGVPHYLRGARFAALALRSRHRDLSEEFRDDAKRYIQMVDRYLEALSAVEDRRP